MNKSRVGALIHWTLSPEAEDASHARRQQACNFPSRHKIFSITQQYLPPLTTITWSPRYFDALYKDNVAIVVTEHNTEPAFKSHPGLRFFTHLSYSGKLSKSTEILPLSLSISSATWKVTPQSRLSTFTLEKITI